MGDATRPSYNKVGSAQTGGYVDDARRMNNNGPREAMGKIDIVAREKQIDANSKIYYVMYPSENKIPTMRNKTNKIPILISSQLNIQLLIKSYNIEIENKQIYCTQARTELRQRSH